MKRFGLFRCAAIDFAVPLFRLRKILHVQQVFELPRLPGNVSGVLVTEGRIVPVLDLPQVVAGSSGAAGAEYLVLVESEYGILSFPADTSSGIIAEQKGAVVPTAEEDASWSTGQFLFQDRAFQILDIDFLAIGLTQGS